MSLYIVDIHGEIEGDYEIVRKYEEQEPKKEKSMEDTWIKCSVHLPALDTDVLGTTKDDGDVVKVTRQRTCLEECGWEWVLTDDVSGTRYKPDDIITWMPLPEGFKEESDETDNS